MKKLCSGKGKRVNPTPWDLLAALPAAVIAMAASLAPEEKEVLAYLLCGGAIIDVENVAGANRLHHRRQAHQPELRCCCFSCYKSFWARWDASPNRHVIHLVLDAVEESLAAESSRAGGRRRHRCRRKNPLQQTSTSISTATSSAASDGEEEDYEGIKRSDGTVSGGDCRSSISRFVSFIGERVLWVWNY
ncbi:hypothetical protein AXF42_Ash004421 [Apostasia shenzhenica]|uniref:Uncharacterized protein n=1 Tax=Apostasia shenzhenica TaxID=1088818 RepID=A0A2I0A2W8_9ASPA|nr:hypothetical protein AXF42_Ash004421 [Apostasia shenzhenica]